MNWLRCFLDDYSEYLILPIMLGAMAMTLGTCAMARAQHDGGGHDGESGGSPSGTAGSDINMGGYRLVDNSGELNLGTAAATNRGLGAGDAIFGGKLEIDGIAYFDGGVVSWTDIHLYGVSNIVHDGRFIIFGSGSDSSLNWATTSNPDALVLGLGSDSRILYITEYSDKAVVWTLAQQPNPTLVLQSSNSSSPTQRLYFAHNQTDGVITTDSGDISLVPSGGDVNITGALTVTTFTLDQFVAIGTSTLGTTAPTTATNASCAGKMFDADAESANITWEIPGCWPGATDIKARVYWCNESGDALADTETVKWDTSFRSILFGTEGADNGTAATPTATYTQSGSGGTADAIETEITLDYDGADQPLTAGDVILMHIDRDVSGDTYSGGAIVTGVEFSFDCNGIPDHM